MLNTNIHKMFIGVKHTTNNKKISASIAIDYIDRIDILVC